MSPRSQCLNASSASAPTRVERHVELDAPGHVLQRREARLAHHALQHHAAGDGDARSPAASSVLVGLGVVARVQVARRARRAGSRSGYALPARAQRGELRAALGDDLVLVRPATGGRHRRSCCRTRLHSLLQARRDEVVEIAVEHGLRVADFVVGPQVLDPRLVEHVASGSGGPSRCRSWRPRASAARPGACAARARRASTSASPSPPRGCGAASGRSGTARRCWSAGA